MVLSGEVFLWSSEKGSWHFVRINQDDGDMIKHITGHLPRKGFGSLKVNASIGATSFTTSIFPEKEGTFLLPVKASVRKKEPVIPGTMIQVELDFVEL